MQHGTSTLRSLLLASRAVLPLAVLVTLSACGSDNDSPAPVTPVNLAPIFSSPATGEVEENSTGVVYQAQASDPDGSSVNFRLVSNNNDSDQFTIDAQTGELRFATAPDFERPTDIDADNIYETTIQARDDLGARTNISVTISVTDIVQTPVLRRVGTGMTQTVFLTDLQDGSGRVLVLERTGTIKILDPDTGTVDPVNFADLSASITTSGEGGLLGLAMAPDFETSRTIYVYVTNTQGDTEIRRYALMSGRSDMIDPATEELIIRVDQPFSNHNAGWIGFDNNGFLMIPLGDGGGSGDPQNLAQDPEELLGKVLRLDVSADDFPADLDRNYAIPPGNTFPNRADGRPEIFAIGLRNPYRASFDPDTGDLLIADVGQRTAEEVSRLPIDDASLNFGWRVKEGNQDFTGSTTATLTPPVIEYLHGTGPRQGRSITGGYVYNGPVEALQNSYVFADFISDNFWAVPVEDMTQGSTVTSDAFEVLTDQFQPDAGTLDFITSFGVDAEGNLYVLNFSGDVWRMEAQTP